MNQPTLKDLAELAGMTEEELFEVANAIIAGYSPYQKPSKLLALALIKARRDELSKFNGVYPPDIAVRISTLTEALKAGGGE